MMSDLPGLIVCVTGRTGCCRHNERSYLRTLFVLAVGNCELQVLGVLKEATELNFGGDAGTVDQTELSRQAESHKLHCGARDGRARDATSKAGYSGVYRKRRRRPPHVPRL